MTQTERDLARAQVTRVFHLQRNRTSFANSKKCRSFEFFNTSFADFQAFLVSFKENFSRYAQELFLLWCRHFQILLHFKNGQKILIVIKVHVVGFFHCFHMKSINAHEMNFMVVFFYI